MARFSADFLPLDGASFFDMSGEMAPQLRVVLNVPEDIDESFFKYNVGDEAHESKSWFENQDKLKNILIEKYRNLAQNRLAVVRRGKNLSSIGIYRQHVDLDNGVTMEYVSLWGREYVTLHFAEWLVRRLMEKIDTGTELYMLVLHSGNKIAYMPMKALSKPKFQTRKLKSSWTTDPTPSYTPLRPAKSSQFKIAENLHVAGVNGIRFEASGKITNMRDGWVQYYNTRDTLLSAAYAPDDDLDIPYNQDSYSSVLFNCTSNVLYDGQGHKFSIIKGKIKYVSRQTAYYGGTPIFPTTTGGYWSNFSYKMDWGSGDLFGYWSSAQRAIADAIPNKNVHWGGPGPGDLTFQMKQGWIAGGTAIDHVLVYSNDGKLDKITLKEVYLSYSEDTGGAPIIIVYDYNGVAGYSGRIDSPPPAADIWYGGGDMFQSVTPTYHLGTDATKDMFLYALLGAFDPLNNVPPRETIGVSYTPFEGRKGDSEPTSVPIVAANGRHYLYLMYRDARNYGSPKTYKLYIDRVDFSTVYETALGIDGLHMIDCILFDIKKSDIDKLV